MDGRGPTGNEISDWLEDREPQMIALLEELVNTDSPSGDKEGVDRVGTSIQRFLGSVGIGCETIGSADYGDAIVARVGPRLDQTNRRPILLMGHRDTVFPKGEAARRPFRIVDGRAYGPGVNDMKSGLVINAFLLAACQELGGLEVPLVGLFTGDEEIGSPFSRPVIEAQARGAAAVFNAEPGRPNGNVVTGRKGGVFMALEVTGKAAHSGANFFVGASAIHELGQKITRLAALTNQAAGITLNVGLVSGGMTVNTVAPSASAEIDLRYVRAPDRAKAIAAIQEIADTCAVPGTSAKLTIRSEFLPLEYNAAGSEALFRTYREASHALGVPVEGEFTGGCADSGAASAQGVPTLCGVGAVGGGSHTPDEYIEIDSLAVRAKALAAAVIRVAATL